MLGEKKFEILIFANPRSGSQQARRFLTKNMKNYEFNFVGDIVANVLVVDVTNPEDLEKGYK